ncbi:MAG: hypothetical protein SCH98_15630 [Deferrisomatales bacterium]|nr:hypothetical protein [Deferrisomatales bacterium]
METELEALGLRAERGEGGVGFSGTWRDAWRANLWSRVASRVLVRVASFEARGFRDLERALGNIPWGEWLPSGCPLDVRAASHRSRLWHTGKVAEVVAGAARAAGVADHLQVAVADVGELEPPEPSGLVAANPPYGHRLGGREAAYAALGRALRGSLRRWRWAVVLSSGAERALGLRPEAVHSFRSGGLHLRWGVGRARGPVQGKGE